MSPISNNKPRQGTSTPLKRALFGLLSIATAIGLSVPAHSADYPTKRVSIIVPYSAGGTTDIIARQIAESLRKQLGKAVTVENRPGAGATLGAMLASKARPDGYTLFMGQVSSHGIAPAVYKNLKYDPIADFQPVTLLLSIPNVMVVRKDHPAQTVAEFLDWAKGKKIRFGSSGVGSSVHLSGEMFKTRTGLEMTHVPFRGSSEAIPALMSGDIDVIFDNLPASMPHIQSKALRALAVTTEARSESLPDIPTLAESGIPELQDFAARSWFGILVPKKVAPEIAAKLSSTLNSIVSSEDFHAFALKQGGVAKQNTPQEFQRFIEAELVKWQAVVTESGVAVN